MADLNKRYAGLFKREVDDDERDAKRGQQGLGKRYGWLVTLDNISGSRPETWSHYYEMRVVEFLNIVSYYKAKQK